MQKRNEPGVTVVPAICIERGMPDAVGVDGYEETLVRTSPNFIARYIPALRVRPYATIFAGQAVSLIGTWMQIVAQG